MNSQPQSRPAVRCRDGWKVDAAGAAVLLALTAAAYLLAVEPQMERHARSVAQESELAAAGEKMSDATLLLAAVKSQLARAREEQAASPLRLQPASQVNQRLAQFTSLATQSRATLDDIQPGKAGAGSQCESLPIQVRGTATYATFAQLLHGLREKFPDTGVSGFDVSGNPQDPLAAVKFSFEMVWYTQKTK